MKNGWVLVWVCVLSLSLGSPARVWADPKQAWQFVKVNYVNPDTLLDFMRHQTASDSLPDVTGPPTPASALWGLKVRVGPLRNGFIVVGDPDGIRRLRDRVSLLDRPPTRIGIRVRMVALDERASRSLGFVPGYPGLSYYTRSPFVTDTILHVLVDQRGDGKTAYDSTVAAETGSVQRVGFGDVAEGSPGMCLELFPQTHGDGYVELGANLVLHSPLPTDHEDKAWLDVRVKTGDTLVIGQFVNEPAIAGNVEAAGPFLRAAATTFPDTHLIILITPTPEPPGQDRNGDRPQ